MKDSLAVEIKNLTKSYGSVKALRGVNLEVKRGEILGFLGPNGAGKTTTIRCLLDLIRPQAGSMRVLGIDPRLKPVEARSRVGYLPGELNLEGNLTIKGVLHYFNDLRGGKSDWSYVKELAERLQLDLEATIKNLSKGNKQKVGLVQALMSKPELLMLDEPTSGLDPLMQQEVYGMLREAQAGGATVFFSSHVISEVETIAERVAILRRGVIVEEGEPGQFLNMSLRRIRLTFKEAVNIEPLLKVGGVSLISKTGGKNVTLKVEGDVERLIKTLASFPVRDIQSEHMSLEEVFLAYYKNDKKEEN